MYMYVDVYSSVYRIHFILYIGWQTYYAKA